MQPQAGICKVTCLLTPLPFKDHVFSLHFVLTVKTIDFIISFLISFLSDFKTESILFILIMPGLHMKTLSEVLGIISLSHSEQND